MSLLDRLLPFNAFARVFRKVDEPARLQHDQTIRNSQGISEIEAQWSSIFNTTNNQYSSDMAGIIYTGVLFDQVLGSKASRIFTYRSMSFSPEVSDALDKVCDEAITPDSNGNIVNLEFKKEFPSHIEEQIRDIWNYLVNDVYSFNERGWEMFRKWLVDSELFVELILNTEGNNIIGIKVLPPHTMLPVYEDNKIKGYVQTLVGGVSQMGIVQGTGSQILDKTTAVTFAGNQIAYVNYGQYGENWLDIRGFLETSIRTYNQLKNLEDSLVIYRLCLDGESRVKTPNGYTYIKNIKIGDDVYAYNKTSGLLELTKVTKVWNNGVKKTVKVKSRHNELICTPDHPILVQNQKTGVIDYVEAGKLIPKTHQLINVPKLSDDVGIDKNLREVIESVKSTINVKYRNDVNLPEYVNEDFARLFGFLLGDGCMGKQDISFAEGTDDDVNELYGGLMSKYFGKCTLYPCRGRKYGTYKSCSALAVEVLKKLGYIHGFNKKRIPDWVFTSKNSIKQAFVEGISDADGCERYTNKGTWFSVIELANKLLIEDIKELWSSIGLSSGEVGHRVHKDHFSEALSRLIRGGNLWNVCLTKLPLDDYENVVVVKEFEEREVYDIEVENNEHNFVANNIPIHNCRAPERRVWNVWTGRMPKGKAEEYMKGLIQRYKKRIIYDPESGAMNTTQNVQSMTEDFWFAKAEGGEGTTVETIGGGMNLGELDDVKYFLEKLYKTLKLPRSRWDDSAGTMYSSGKSGEILREEINFANFVQRLARRFSYVLIEPFLTLLKLRGIDPKYIKENFYSVKFIQSNLFKQYREMELTEARFGILSNVSEFIYDKNENPKGFFAPDFALKHFFLLTDEEKQDNDDLMSRLRASVQEGGEGEGIPGESGGLGAGGELGGLGGTELGGAGGLEGIPGETAATPAPEAGGAEELISPANIAPESLEFNVSNPNKNGGLFTNWLLDDKTIKDKYKDGGLIDRNNVV